MRWRLPLLLATTTSVLVAGVQWLFLVSLLAPSAFLFGASLNVMDLTTKDVSSGLPSRMKFVTNKMCPYAQKAWIALEVTHCDYELVEVSLYGNNGKPDWFWKLNPQGTVPVLVVHNNDDETEGNPVILPDSDLILNFLQDRHSSLPPDRSRQQAAIQTWRNRVRFLQPVAKKVVLGGGGNIRSGELHQCLQTMNDAVVGPFLTGDCATMADCHAFPFLWRLDQEFGLREYPKLHLWIERCSEEPAFRKTIQSSWWWWW